MSNLFEGQDFVRKQFPVQAVRVTPLNINELAEACGGQIKHDGDKEGNFSRDYIKVRVSFPINEEQTKARIGDWLVKQGKTFKVYKDKAFRSTFEFKDGTQVLPEGQKPQGKSRPQKKRKGPNPNQMPKMRGPRPDRVIFDEIPAGDDAVVESSDEKKPLEVTSPEAAVVRRHEELAEGGVTAIPVESVPLEEKGAEMQIMHDVVYPEHEDLSGQIENEPEPKPITLDELEGKTVRPGDEPTPGERFRGEI